MRMLFPEPVEDVDPATVYADVPHNDVRPAVRLNMIVSVDGGTSWNGVSGALGGSADKALFGVLRSLADVVLVASATMRGEHYGPAEPRRRSRTHAGDMVRHRFRGSRWCRAHASSTGPHRSSRRRPSARSCHRVVGIGGGSDPSCRGRRGDRRG